MATAASEHPFGAIVVDVFHRTPPVPSRPVRGMAPEEKAAELQRIQAERARLAAREAEVILGFAADRPDDEDPPDHHPGARSRTWRQTHPEFPGVSESFPQELAMVLGVGRGTAVHKLRRAWTLRYSLPRTEAAQQRGEIDERRVQILADTLEHIAPALAGRVEAIVLPTAHEFGFAALERRILEVLLELDPQSAEENRETAEASADVFLEPGYDGRATLGAELNADEAAEAYDFIDTLARYAKKDGDTRPIGQIRNEIYSLLVRGAAAGAHGARANITITAALEALERATTQPADVNGFAISPAHLTNLLRRVRALGLQPPEDGTLTFAITDEDSRLLATLGMADLQQRVRRGEGADPPEATGNYSPTAEQREFVTTRDRSCRMPLCGQRTGWADHDHVVAHSAGGPTTCTNLCCLCRTCHRLKTLFEGWLFVMEPDGILHVTTPSGVTRTSRPWSLRRRPPEPPPPEDPPPF